MCYLKATGVGCMEDRQYCRTDYAYSNCNTIAFAEQETAAASCNMHLMGVNIAKQKRGTLNDSLAMCCAARMISIMI